jgi:hypothetical protein
MSQRTVLRPSTLPTLDMSQSSVASSATVLQGLSMLSYAISWTGSTPTGTISLEFSDDYSISPNGTVLNAGTWNVAPILVNGNIQTTAPVSGNTGNGIIDIAQTGNYASRILYTRSGGSGTMTVIVTGKVS